MAHSPRPIIIIKLPIIAVPQPNITAKPRLTMKPAITKAGDHHAHIALWFPRCTRPIMAARPASTMPTSTAALKKAERNRGRAKLAPLS